MRTVAKAPLNPPSLGAVKADFPRVGDAGAKIGFNYVSPILLKVSLQNVGFDARHQADNIA
ncbi:MAG: hypothetical protein AAF827_00795 [Cyanobacteria bacterium P01_D01_bin.6]